MRSKFRLLLAVLALALSSVAAHAATTGRLIGVVTDDSKAPLPGVTVTVSGPQLQGTRTAVTSAQGEYEFPLLPPGTYRAEFELTGLQGSKRDNVVVALDQTTRIDAILSLGRVTDVITVTADTVVIDPTETTTKANFKEDHLKYASVGQAQRDYLSVMLQAPGVVEDAANGNPQVMGANSGQSSFVLDGVNSTDPVTHTFGANLVFDSIQEMSVQTLGKDAEYGRAVGGVINVVTKSGGNSFSGTFDARYNSDALIQSGQERRPNGKLRFDKSTQNFSNRDPSVTFGGPIVTDKAWFFGAYSKPLTKKVNVQLFDFAPGSRDFDGWNGFGKITATPLANQTLTLRYTGDGATVDHSRNSSFYRPEADSLSAQGNRIPTASYDAVLNSKWLASVQLARVTGTFSSKPYNGIDTSAVQDLITGVFSVNYGNYQSRKSTRDQFIASTTYYVQQYGTHAIKVGTDIEKNQFGSLNFVTGTPPNASFCSESLGYDPGSVCGAVFQTRNGAPFRVVVSNRNPEETVHSSNRAFYAQDEWRPSSKVTARVGLRYEVTTFEPAGHQSVPDFRLWQPRIGVAYDLFDNAQSVIHGFAGRIMDDNALTLPSFLSPLGTLTTTFQLNSAGVYVPRAQSGGPTGNQVDPTLHPTSSDEYSIGFTQRVFRNTNLDLTVVSRKSHDMFEDTCVNQQDCPFFWLTNRPNNDPNALRSDYHGAILKLESRPFSWLSGLVSYTYSKSRGSVEYDQNSGADFDIFPDHFVNRYGYLSDDARHRVKINGYAHAPYGITIGVNANWDSGVPYNVTTPAPSYSVEFLEPRGSRRVPSFRQVDLQVQKDFQLGFVRAGLVAAVSNVLNTEIALTADGNAGSGGTVASPTNPNFGLATSWQRPRRYDLGVRFEF